MLLPSAVWGQNLPSTPLSWQAALAPAVAPSMSLPSAGSDQGSFLKGRFLVGINFTHALAPDRHIGSRWSVSPFFRNTPRRVGWGPSFGLSWFTGDISVAIDGVQTTVGEVKVRPVMVGIGYTLNSGRLRTTLSFVGGYAFTDARVTAALPEGTTASIDIKDSWVLRPNVGLTFAMTRRLAIVGSIGYIYTNPTIAIDVTRLGRSVSSVTGAYRGDYLNMTIGTAVSIF